MFRSRTLHQAGAPGAVTGLTKGSLLNQTFAAAPLAAQTLRLMEVARAGGVPPGARGGGAAAGRRELEVAVRGRAQDAEAVSTCHIVAHLLRGTSLLEVAMFRAPTPPPGWRRRQRQRG